MQLGPVIRILVKLSYSKNGTSQEATTPADPSINQANQICFSPLDGMCSNQVTAQQQQQKPTTPPTATYETGQQPRTVPLPNFIHP